MYQQPAYGVGRPVGFVYSPPPTSSIVLQLLFHCGKCAYKIRQGNTEQEKNNEKRRELIVIFKISTLWPGIFKVKMTDI